MPGRDSEVRARRRERAAKRRAELDRDYVRFFAGRIRKLFPGCPTRVAANIGEHACLKYSGRIGRSAAAKALDKDAVRLAVAAHIRHCKTNCDELLARGIERYESRRQVRYEVDLILRDWGNPIENLESGSEVPEAAC